MTPDPVVRLLLIATISRERYYRRHGYPQYRRGYHHHGCGYHHHQGHPGVPPEGQSTPAATPGPAAAEGSAS